MSKVPRVVPEISDSPVQLRQVGEMIFYFVEHIDHQVICTNSQMLKRRLFRAKKCTKDVTDAVVRYMITVEVQGQGSEGESEVPEIPSKGSKIVGVVEFN